MLTLIFMGGGVPIPPPPPVLPAQASPGVGSVYSIAYSGGKDLRKKRRVRLAARGQLLFPADLAEQHKIEEDWLVHDLDPMEYELVNERLE